MITKEEVKNYLRVDTTEDDNFIDDCILVAQDYMLNAIDDFEFKKNNNGFGAKAKICQLALIQDMYDNRYLISKDTDLSYTIKSIITQLQNQIVVIQ